MTETAASAALQSVLDTYRKDSDHVFLSRGDLRDLGAKTDLAEFVMATIIWGYPRGMRGHNFSNLINHLDSLCQLLSDAHSCPMSSWISHYKNVKQIRGIALSTYSKFLHFLSVKIGEHEALILDQRIIEVVRQNLFEELAPLRRRSLGNASRLYPEYLERMNSVASRLSVPPDKIEFFLFEFGLHLKSRPEASGVEVTKSQQRHSNEF